MVVKSLGWVVVATGGTPVRVTTDTDIVARKVTFRPVTGCGTMFIGLVSMVKTTGVNVISEIAALATSGHADEIVIEAAGGGNPIRVADFWIDGTTGDKLSVSYQVE